MVLNAASAKATPAGEGGSADLLARRLRKRRPTYVAQAASYLFDLLILIPYALLGVTTDTAVMLYVVSGLATVFAFALLSEVHVNDRFRDHYLTVPQGLANIAVLMAAIVMMPAIGFYFVCIIFIVLSFATLRMSPVQGSCIWAFASLGMTAVVFSFDHVIGLPNASMTERILALLCFSSTLARFCITGLFGAGLRKTFYQRSNELAEANRRIAEMARIDELTGALNRPAVMAELERETLDAGRVHNVCVALIDLDHFKRINDRFGHPVGDDALRIFAMNLAVNLRPQDHFGRYGGEEFLLVMPELDLQHAGAMLERLRDIIACLNWGAIAPGLALTMSCGVSAIAMDETPDAVLARIDLALYRAKAEGRNRIVTVNTLPLVRAPTLQPYPQVAVSHPAMSLET